MAAYPEGNELIQLMKQQNVILGKILEALQNGGPPVDVDGGPPVDVDGVSQYLTFYLRDFLDRKVKTKG